MRRKVYRQRASSVRSARGQDPRLRTDPRTIMSGRQPRSRVPRWSTWPPTVIVALILGLSLSPAASAQDVWLQNRFGPTSIPVTGPRGRTGRARRTRGRARSTAAASRSARTCPRSADGWRGSARPASTRPLKSDDEDGIGRGIARARTLDEELAREHGLLDRERRHVPERGSRSHAAYETAWQLTRPLIGRMTASLGTFALEEGVEHRSPFTDSRVLRFAASRPSAVPVLMS